MEKSNKNKSGFSLVELIIVLGMISTLSGLALPSFLNWIRLERVNAYTREVKEYFRVVRLEARRWGATCFINVNPISNGSLSRRESSDGYSVECKYSIDPNSSQNSKSRIGTLVPKINNSVFQIVNKNFQVTPNGRISSKDSILVLIGSRYQKSSSKFLNCLVINSPTGHIMKGKFPNQNWINSDIAISELSENSALIPDNCRYN